MGKKILNITKVRKCCINCRKHLDSYKKTCDNIFLNVKSIGNCWVGVDSDTFYKIVSNDYASFNDLYDSLNKKQRILDGFVEKIDAFLREYGYSTNDELILTYDEDEVNDCYQLFDEIDKNAKDATWWQEEPWNYSVDVDKVNIIKDEIREVRTGFKEIRKKISNFQKSLNQIFSYDMSSSDALSIIYVDNKVIEYSSPVISFFGNLSFFNNNSASSIITNTNANKVSAIKSNFSDAKNNYLNSVDVNGQVATEGAYDSDAKKDYEESIKVLDQVATEGAYDSDTKKDYEESIKVLDQVATEGAIGKIDEIEYDKSVAVTNSVNTTDVTEDESIGNTSLTSPMIKNDSDASELSVDSVEINKQKGVSTTVDTLFDDSSLNYDEIAVGGIAGTSAFVKTSSDTSHLNSNTIGVDIKNGISNYSKVNNEDLTSNMMEVDKQHLGSTLVDTSINNDFNLETTSVNTSSMNTSGLNKVSNADIKSINSVSVDGL